MPFPVGPNLVFWGPVAVLAFMFWKRKPPLLRITLPTILIPLVVCMCLFSFVTEIRIGYEVLPVVLLLFFHTIIVLWGGSPAPGNPIGA